MLKVRKTAKFDLNSWVGISRTTTARVSKSCVVLSLELSNISPKTGVWSKNGVELLKVRKKAKFDLYLWVDISQTTTARASKFFVGLWLELSIIFLKSGVWTTYGLEMLKVRV